MNSTLIDQLDTQAKRLASSKDEVTAQAGESFGFAVELLRHARDMAELERERADSAQRRLDDLRASIPAIVSDALAALRS